MGFRARPGSLRAGGCEIAGPNKEVQIPRRWHRRCCRAPQNHRPDQLGSRSALATPWARLVSDWGHQGLCLRVLGAHFGHILAHILHAGWRAGHHGVNFRNSDLVEVRWRRSGLVAIRTSEVVIGYVLSAFNLVELDLWDKSRESENKIGIRAVESALADMGLADMLAT